MNLYRCIFFMLIWLVWPSISFGQDVWVQGEVSPDDETRIAELIGEVGRVASKKRIDLYYEKVKIFRFKKAALQNQTLILDKVRLLAQKSKGKSIKKDEEVVQARSSILAHYKNKNDVITFDLLSGEEAANSYSEFGELKSHIGAKYGITKMKKTAVFYAARKAPCFAEITIMIPGPRSNVPWQCHYVSKGIGYQGFLFKIKACRTVKMDDIVVHIKSLTDGFLTFDFPLSGFGDLMNITDLIDYKEYCFFFRCESMFDNCCDIDLEGDYELTFSSKSNDTRISFPGTKKIHFGSFDPMSKYPPCDCN